ncbi:MAG: asparagine synthase (glutamine-hydrolyzing) [Lachnospiraceae bacterium]|nr:asparagine synthase (glutamine-hydrolyzing) [Lachnospiraceae bacterium]
MCGILGIYRKRVERSRVKKCLDTIRHRGPDGEGIWQEGDVSLGHRRLAILDLSETASQPMTDASGRYQIVFNGEIYNFLEIRKELEGLGHVFRTDGDTEVLLESYVEWGEECLLRLNGMWSFAVYDRMEQTMFLARDRFGVKPLFYTEFSGGEGYSFAFASEMKALLPLMDEVRPNRSVVCRPERYVHYETTEECAFEGIRRLPAGSCARAGKNGMKVRRYWDTLDHLVKVPQTFEEQAQMLRELFLDACRIRMRSDVPLGTALSGGLDSSSTICSMARIAQSMGGDRVSRDWQHAYVASFPGTTMDETEYAKCVTDSLKVASTFVEIDPTSCIGKLDEMFYLFEEVYITSPVPMMLLYGALREGGTIVTLDGHAADELFGGYPFDFLHAFDDARTAEEREMVALAYNGSFPHDGSNNARREKSANALMFEYKRKKITRALRGDTVRPKAYGDPRFMALDHLNRVLYASSHENILPTLLRNYDHYSMANSVEIRMPFLDHRIVEFAFSIGWKSKLHGGYPKAVIREAMKGIIPEKIEKRRSKLGFNTPIVEWMKGPLKEYFEDTVSSADFCNTDLLDAKSVAEKVRQVIRDPEASFVQGEQAFSALYPYLWDRAFRMRADG